MVINLLSGAIEQVFRGFMRISRGVFWLADWSTRAIIDRIETHIIFAWFYELVALIYTLLYYVSPDSPNTIHIMQRLFGVPYSAPIIVFAVCGIALLTSQHHYVYMVCITPLLAYGVCVAIATGLGYITILGWPASLYVVVLSITGLVSIRNRFRLHTVEGRVQALERAIIQDELSVSTD